MNTLKLITKPYSFNGILLEAYNDIFNLVELNDWVCFMDADAAFLETSNFGHVLQAYINKYPETGAFTCYATRCHYDTQRLPHVNQAQDSIKYHAAQIIAARKTNHLKTAQLNRRIAGHLIVIKKATWVKILPTLKAKAANKKILGFDTKLSYSLLEHGYDIKLMQGLLIFHYLRFLTGKNTLIK